MTNVLKNLLGNSFKEGMTPDEVVKAINELTEDPIEKSLAELNNMKTRLSEVNSQAASYKKELRAKQTEEEQKEADRAEQLKKLTDELDALKHDKQVAETTAKFAAAGFGDASGSVAEAFLKGDIDSVVASINTQTKNHEDAVKAELLKGTQRPAAGNADKEKMTMDKLYAMSFEDRMRFIREHKAEYDEIAKTE